MNDLDLCLEVL